MKRQKVEAILLSSTIRIWLLDIMHSPPSWAAYLFGGHVPVTFSPIEYELTRSEAQTEIRYPGDGANGRREPDHLQTSFCADKITY